MCIQTGGRFIQKQHLRFNDELHANVGSLFLTTRHTTDELCTNLVGNCKLIYCRVCVIAQIGFSTGTCV